MHELLANDRDMSSPGMTFMRDTTMTIDPLRSPTPVRRRLAAAGVIALAVAVPGDRLAAQSWPGIGDTLLAPALRDSLAARNTSQGCLALRVVPGDTAGRAMPRASGNVLVDPRMPRRTTSRPPCETLLAIQPLATRLQEALQGNWSRAIPVPALVVPPRPRP